MDWIDTHAHLFHTDYEHDRQEVVARCLSNGVNRVVVPNLSSDTLPALQAFARKEKDLCLPCVGLHPCYVAADYEQKLPLLAAALADNSIGWVGIGETGLDLFRGHEDTLPMQEASFLRHCEWALSYDLPLVLHAREAVRPLVALLSQSDYKSKLKGVFHCFTASREEARAVLDLGFYIGIGGVLTYKSGEALRELTRYLPQDRVLLETDSPYLAPAGAKTRRNEPVFMLHTARLLARCKHLSLEALAECTTENAKRLFLRDG